MVFPHLRKGKDVGYGALAVLHRSGLCNIGFMIGGSHSSDRMDSDGFRRDPDIVHQIRVSEDVRIQTIVQQYPPWWKAPSAHVCRNDGFMHKEDVNSPNFFARFVVLLLLLHSRYHLILALLIFGFLGIIRILFDANTVPSIVVHLCIPRVIGITASTSLSIVNHQLLDFVLHILVPDLEGL